MLLEVAEMGVMGRGMALELSWHGNRNRHVKGHGGRA